MATDNKNVTKVLQNGLKWYKIWVFSQNIHNLDTICCPSKVLKSGQKVGKVATFIVSLVINVD